MAEYTLARGTTLALTVTVTQNGAPVNLTGHHVVFTCKTSLSETDAQAVAQLDNALLGGVVLANQSTLPGVCYVTMPASATQALPNPSPTTLLYYDIVDNDGASPTPNVWQTESGTIELQARTSLTPP